MKKLTISDFKGEHFDVIQVVESVVSFNIKDPRKTISDILEAQDDCDSIVEAIEYKKEKMKRGIDSQKDIVLQELCTELQKEVGNIHLNEFNNSFRILEQKKAINELKRIQKILKYSIQMEQHTEQILESLVSSDSPEEWMFLAEILYAHNTFSKSVNFTLLNTYSKKLQEKVSNCFEKALSTNDIALTKLCFDILSTLDKEFTLIDEFLLAKDLFKSSMVVHPLTISKIDLDSKDDRPSSFKAFLDQTEKAIGDNFNMICLVFGHKDEYIDYILSKIYRTLISISLSDFLSVSNPPVFLICLKDAYEATKSFGKSIKFLFQKFDYSSCVDEIFSRFIFTATTKEKQLVEETFDTMVFGTKQLNTYYIEGQKVEKFNNFKFIFNKILIILNEFMIRSEMMYSKDNQKEVLDKVSDKLCNLIEKMYVSYNVRLDLINDLIYMYLTNCKFFWDKGESLSKFNVKITETITNEFEKQIEISSQFLKNEISNLFFTKIGCHKRIKICIEKLFLNSGKMGEKNFKTFTYRIIGYLYNLLYKQVQLVEINEDKLKNIHSCIEDIFLTLPINCSSNFLVKFTHLKNFTEAVLIDQEKFNEMIHKDLFSETEVKYLLRCRSKNVIPKQSTSVSKAS